MLPKFQRLGLPKYAVDDAGEGLQFGTPGRSLAQVTRRAAVEVDTVGAKASSYGLLSLTIGRTVACKPETPGYPEETAAGRDVSLPKSPGMLTLNR